MELLKDSAWRSIAVGVFGFVALTVGGALAPHRAHAAFTVCNTDPIIQLSNGQTIQLQASISADLSQIDSVVYNVHAPAGTTVTSISYDAAGAAVESVNFTADQSQGHYWSATKVLTSTATAVPVTVTGSLSNYGTGSANGSSGQTVYLGTGGN